MMQTAKIFFSRGIQKRNLDFRRFNSHLQFHSFFYSDDGRSFCRRDSITTGFSLLQNRWQTTDINCNRVSSERNAPAIDGLIQSLKEDVRKGDFRKFDINVELLSKTVFVSKAALNREQTQRFTLCLKEWNNQNHSGRQYASVLKFMANLRFSVLNADQKELIVAIVDKFFEKNQQSFRWLGLFLTGIRGLKYSGALLKSNHRQRILESLSELKEDSHERSYAELISGIVGLGINWEEINEAGKRNLLNQLETVKATLTARNINTVIFNFGKLGVI
jgi:transposase-like protein